MLRKFSALLAAALFTFTTLMPATAAAQHRRDRHDGYYRDYGGGDHYRGDRHRRGDRYNRRHRDRDDDAIVAGVIGLLVGVAIGSAASQRRDERRYDDYRAPPPRGYYNQGYNQPRPYEDGYYDDDYGPEDPPCIRRERQWDRYANRYVTVDVPC